MYNHIIWFDLQIDLYQRVTFTVHECQMQNAWSVNICDPFFPSKVCCYNDSMWCYEHDCYMTPHSYAEKTINRFFTIRMRIPLSKYMYTSWRSPYFQKQSFFLHISISDKWFSYEIFNGLMHIFSPVYSQCVPPTQRFSSIFFFILYQEYIRRTFFRLSDKNAGINRLGGTCAEIPTVIRF